MSPVHAPHLAGGIAKRTEPATPFTLNEPGQPVRKGTSPDELRAELAAIIDWLAVETGRSNWWRGAEFAESTFWIHG